MVKTGSKRGDRIVGLQRVDASLIDPHPSNFRVHGAEQTDALRRSLEQLGIYDVAIVRRKGKRFELIDGHLRRELVGASQPVPVLVVDLSPAEARAALATHDATTAMAEVDRAAMAALIEACRGGGEELDALLDSAAAAEGLALLDSACLPAAEPEPAEEKENKNDRMVAAGRELIKKWGVEPGGVWLCRGEGLHHVYCGDSTGDRWGEVALEAGVDFLFTDPPYCSGDGQSVGTTAKSQKQFKRVANDHLSTRGYVALLTRVFDQLTTVQGAYVFTDWRMWSVLFDLLESRGFGLKSMLVWDKLHGGMGLGWRAQHELVAVAARPGFRFGQKSSAGNVLQAARTGNVKHTTEKPVAMLRKMFAVASAARVVADPFGGSGTTALAAEQEGRGSASAELDPGYVGTIIERLAEAGCVVERVS